MMLTEKETRAAWDRLRYDKSACGDRLLSHTMMVAGANLKLIKAERPEIYNQTKAVYRMVGRGVITTRAQFDRIARKMLAKTNA